MDPSKVERQSTFASGIILIVLFASILAAAVAVVMVPGLLENIVFVVVVVLVGIMAIATVILILTGVLAIPVYMKKGVETQTDMSYNLDDVKGVDGAMVEVKK